jgi:superfamily II DNA or RNA helicase/HKD family nuclease
MNYEDGLHERLLELGEDLESSEFFAKLVKVSSLDDKKRLASMFLELKFGELVSQVESSESLISLLERVSTVTDRIPYFSENGDFSELLWITRNKSQDENRLEKRRPLTPLNEQALFTNSRGEPRIDSQLENELATSDSVDVIVSFIKLSGLRLLEQQLLKLRDRGVPVRVITTTYMGATEKKAIDRLVNELGARVRIDLKPDSNRLHAKAWLFNRKTGYSTAVIGSSNMSQSALTYGSEWNVRLSQTKGPELLEKFKASFETYWESPTYLEYTTETLGDALEESLAHQNSKYPSEPLLLSQLEVSARPHQTRMLDELRVARDVFGHSRNLVVAATGTGKTVLAALDYKRLIRSGEPRPTLLFVAHRKEILQQALSTFRQVLGDAQFGELFVDGQKPKEWLHVFASIQSLKGEVFVSLGEEHFQHLIIDEFHHAEATSYKRLFTDIIPSQVVGLTATPERTDGVDEIWKEYFGGRIATELRLWEAMSQDLLAPFHYFGIGEDLDFSNLPWAGGKYDASALSALITSNTIRNQRVLKELNSKLPELGAMKALVFCVSVDHAQQVAKDFSAAGVKTKSVTASTENRNLVIQELRTGQIQAITTVDVFNEGVDIPEVDTIVLLRPTESPVIFLQQIGRGLRRFPGKEHVLVLDFIGSHRAEYRVDKKYEALAGMSRADIIDNLINGFPFLPSGNAIQLDKLSQEHILDLIKRQVKPNWANLILEVKSSKLTSLKDYLSSSGRDLFEIYRSGDRDKNWTAMLREAGLLATQLTDAENALMRKIHRLLHLDDVHRLDKYLQLLANDYPSWESQSENQRRWSSMFFWNLFEDGKNPSTGKIWNSIDAALGELRKSSAFVSEVKFLFEVLRSQLKAMGDKFELSSLDHPLVAHATYTRFELLGALGFARLSGNSIYEDGTTKTLENAREGVYYIPKAKLDLFLVTLQKSEKLSPSIQYHDYAISPNLFHWESQSKTSSDSATGQRYINQKPGTSDVLIATREKSAGANGTIHFKLLGPADYVKHEGSKPIAIWWRLRIAMDPDSYEQAAAAKAS